MASAAAVTATNGSGAIITEVVVQGVRRFGDVRRFAFGPGYNVVYGLASSGKTTLHDVVVSLLFGMPAEGEAQSFASLLPQGQVACRAGMTLSLGGDLWRVLKDFQQGVTTLSKYDAAGRKFDLVYSDAGEVRRWLVETARLPAGPHAGTVCSIKKTEFPSIADGAAVVTVRRETEDTGFEERIRALSLPDKKALLTQLLDEYRRHADVRTTEFLQDGLRSKLFEVEAVQRKRVEIRKKIDECELEWKDIANVPKLPDGIDERIEAYKRQEKQREAELANLLPMQESARAELQMTIPAPYDEKTFRKLSSPMDMVIEPMKRDFILDGGLAALFAGVVAAFFGATAMKIGGLVGLIGIGVVLWRGVFVFYRSLEQFGVLRKRVDQVDEQLRILERKWDIETSVVRNLMKAYDVDDPRELKDLEKKRDDGVAARAKLQEELDAAVLKDAPKKDLDREHARITQQIADLDQRLQELSKDMTTDPKELEPQIERLEREVARAEGRKPASRAKLFQNADEGDDPEGKNAVTRLLDAWCAANRAELGRVLRGILDAYGRNLRALSGGRFTDASFDAEGNLSVREEPRGLVPWEMLDGAARDIAYLALRITLFQLDAKGDGRAVVVLDDPFEFEEPRLQAISRALRALAPRAQVLHLTSRPVHGKLADANQEI